jgi:hypothetical protein
MGDGIEFQVTGLREFAAAASRAVPVTSAAMLAAITKSAMAVKKDWAARWSGMGHAPALPAAVSYDITFGFGGVKAEVGPDKGRRQGALGNLLEFGSANNAPRPGGLPALDAEAPRFEQALAEAAGKVLDG